MKAIFIACDQSVYDSVIDTMDSVGARGFTGWEELIGRGTTTGEPHLGSHAWPTMNSALLTIVEDEKATELLKRLKALDEENPHLGLRAFAWPIAEMI